MGGQLSEVMRRLLLPFTRTRDLSQTYNDPVGYVINGETVYVGCSTRSASNAGAPAPHSVEAAIMLVDRRRHLDAFNARIKHCLATGIHRRLLVVVSGMQKDLPEVFVTRCGNIELQAGYDLQGGRFLGQLHWPKGACDIQAVLDTIIVGLDLPRQTGVMELKRYLVSLKNGVCFSH